jgi:hypothetical protein
MAIVELNKLLHWNYFLSIEEDLHRLSRFVEFTVDNFETHSIELARILLAASAEVDVVAKQLCGQIGIGRNASNIDDYEEVIEVELQILIETHVDIPRHGLTLRPWGNWEDGKNPDWWRAYNNVKHSRHEHYRSANLKNALNAVSALFLLLLFFYREQATPARLGPNPSMLRLGAPLGDDSLFWDPGKALAYRLDKHSL